MNIAAALVDLSAVLADHGVAEPRREATLLVALATGRDRAFLIAHPEYELSTLEKMRLDGFARRRADREPFQYISGRQEFFGLDFDVTTDVLIPRPETEIVVEKAISFLAELESPPSLCEVGIGSGCIAVSVLVNEARTDAMGLDISPNALAVAAANSHKHGVGDRLRLARSDIFDFLHDEKFDMIVSNPPYVPSSDIDNLQPEVRDFEPAFALTDGGNGLSIIRAIIDKSPRFLKPGGHILMEIGFGQSGEVAEMFDNKLWGKPNFFPDLQGIPRVVYANLAKNALEQRF